MPETIIENSFSTETIQNMELPKEILPFIKKPSIKKIYHLIILDLFAEIFRHGGSRKIEYFIQKYEQWSKE